MTIDAASPAHPRRRGRLLGTAAALLGLTLIGAAATSATSASLGGTQPAAVAASGTAKAGPKPTIVLVHGAFADSSGWSAVAQRLMASGYPVLAFSNPLRGPTSDGAYLRQFLTTITGPVVLVGHSYGGAVITNAAANNPSVKSLVYVAAYALDQGESVAQANELGGGHTHVTDHLVVRPYPGAPPGDGDAYIDPAWYHRLFSQDLDSRTSQLMAASQRPGALSALVTPSGPAAWKTTPSWYLVANQDRIIPPEAERAMAKRANATTVRIDSSHVAMISHPDVVTRLIQSAAR